MDQRTRKLMTTHNVLYPRDNIDRLYVYKKEGGRGHVIIEDSFDESIRRLEGYIKKKESLISATKNSTNNTRNSKTIITSLVGDPPMTRKNGLAQREY